MNIKYQELQFMCLIHNGSHADTEKRINKLRYVNVFNEPQVYVWGHTDHLQTVRS